MTLDQAMQAAADNRDECIGFCWNGPRDPKTVVTCFLKNKDCSDAIGGAGGDWHTYLLLPLLKVSDTPEGEIITATAVKPPASHQVSPEHGMWPAELLSQYKRAGDANIGFAEDPLDAVLNALNGARFVDAEFPPTPLSLGKGKSNSAISGTDNEAMPDLDWKPAPVLLGPKGQRSIASVNAKKKVRITAKNETGKPVQMFWIDYGGVETAFGGPLAAGATWGPVDTFATHVWRVKFEEGNEVWGFLSTLTTSL